MNFKAVLALPKTAPSAQTYKSITSLKNTVNLQIFFFAKNTLWKTCPAFCRRILQLNWPLVCKTIGVCVFLIALILHAIPNLIFKTLYSCKFRLKSFIHNISVKPQKYIVNHLKNRKSTKISILQRSAYHRAQLTYSRQKKSPIVLHWKRKQISISPKGFFFLVLSMWKKSNKY